jgi:hypothetical protein
MTLLDSIWDCNIENQHSELAIIYQRFASLLPLLANSALDTQPQLEALERCSTVGSDAFVNAVMAGNLALGLETLELAQGVIWSQSLHRRDPQLKNVPERLASDLQQILQAVATKTATQSYRGEAPARTPHDALHANSSQLHALMREIRAFPGLDRFMLGESYEALCSAASDQHVVVLVGARGHYFAFIAASSLDQAHALLMLDLADEDLNNLNFTPGASRLRHGSGTPEVTHSPLERLSMGKKAPTRHEPINLYFKALWRKVVKPVLDHLGFKVSKPKSSNVDTSLISVTAFTQPGPTTPLLVFYWYIQLCSIARSRYL